MDGVMKSVEFVGEVGHLKRTDRVVGWDEIFVYHRTTGAQFVITEDRVLDVVASS